jgi:glycosyltransferase involved in cell wall biosynthesis
MSAKISAFILAYNSESQIGKALKSLQWVDEIVVIDSHSTDRTVAIAGEYGAKVVQEDFRGFGRLRNAGIEHTTHEWIFSLDTDECCTPEARDEIQIIINSKNAADAYHTPRRNYFMGRFIKYGGWYPNYRQPQLFRRGKLTFPEDDLVHEGFNLEGRLAQMRCAIEQEPFETLSDVLHKANRYSSLSAEKLARDRRQAGALGALAHGLGMFFKMYILRLGILDGWPGFIIAWSNLEGTFYKYAKLAELNRKGRKQGE